MQMLYTTEVSSLSPTCLRNAVIQVKDISQLASFTRGENCSSRVGLNLTATRRDGDWQSLQNCKLVGVKLCCLWLISPIPSWISITWTTVWCFFDWGSVKCRLRTDCGLLFLGLENNGTIIVTFHLHGENNSPQSVFFTDRFSIRKLRRYFLSEYVLTGERFCLSGWGWNSFNFSWKVNFVKFLIFDLIFAN